MFQTWENETGWIWLELSKCSNSILDIGANTGIYSMIAKTLNPDSEIYAFERSNHTYSTLVENSELNNFDISCEQMALFNFSGDQVFYDIPDSNQTSASLSSKKL